MSAENLEEREKEGGGAEPGVGEKEKDEAAGVSEEGEQQDEGVGGSMEDLKEELGKMTISPLMTERPLVENYDASLFPGSYRENSYNEVMALKYAENFRRQYVHLYRDRKPLLLKPVNENGVEKFVCTTIKPTEFLHQELNEWDVIADLIAGYLDFVPLNPPYVLPEQMISPASVIKYQKGNCFEYSTLLSSLLIGVGYDAYVVSGYATCEFCLADETREICPLQKKKEEQESKAPEKELKKYTVKPPKDLKSKFEEAQREKVEKKEAKEAARKRMEEEFRIAELEKPPPDPLWGLRIHSWVMVLANKREVPEGFFIEPFTGLSQPLNSEHYLGIESLWNHKNYWVNMQDCSEGVTKLDYDLGDCTKWEYMFPSNEKPVLQIPEVGYNLELDAEEEDEDEIEKHFDVPHSWVEPLQLSIKDFQIRYPKGKKNKFYKRARLEKFAHYLMPNGLEARLSVYEDLELTDLIFEKELFVHREDMLHTRIHNHKSGWVTEYFDHGRPRCLKEHKYRASMPGPENERMMVFYHEARVSGIVKRVETPSEMTEYYQNRPDFLHYKHIDFSRKPKVFAPQEDATSKNQRPIKKIIEKFNRNRAKESDKDVAEIIYDAIEEKIFVTYHTDDSRIACSTEEYHKPPNWQDRNPTAIGWSPDMYNNFKVDPSTPEEKQLALYQRLRYLLNEEHRSIDYVRSSEEEVKEILNIRMIEQSKLQLNVSVYDTLRNEKAKKHRQELNERMELEERLKKEAMKIDYLAPFLVQFGGIEKLSRQEAYRVKEDCLADLKQRLIDKANLIQARFEKETQELQKKQTWYQQNQISMHKEDEEDYLNYCAEAMFRIHILELRLNRHKEMAPQKYMTMERKLRADPRLIEYYSG